MTSPKRQRLGPAQRRAQLIALGVQALGTHALDEISIESIADQAGVTRALVFHYFKSKQEFQTAILQAASEHMMEITTPDLSLPPLEILRSTLNAYIDYVGRNPHVYIAMIRGETSNVPAMKESVDATRSRLAERILEMLGRFGLDSGPLLEFAVRGWLAFVEEVVIRWLTDSEEVTREQLLELLTGALPGVVMAPLLGDQGMLEQMFPGLPDRAGEQEQAAG